MNKRQNTLMTFIVCMAAMLLGSFIAEAAVSSKAISASRAMTIEMGSPFQNNAVLQRGMKLPVWGWSNAGAKITVEFAGQKRTTTAGKDGSPSSSKGYAVARWIVELDPLKASSVAQLMSVTSSAGNKRVQVKNLLVGDVFLCARQTTIDISLGRDADGRKVAGSYKQDPFLRVISIKTIPAITPQETLDSAATAGWSEVSKESALKMSASAFYLGRDLSAELKVPVGIIDLNMGSAFTISWLSREALMESTSLYGPNHLEGLVTRMENLADLKAKGEPMPRKEAVHSDPLHYPIYPAAGYNAVINPLRGMVLKGIVVQLGANYPYMIYTDLKAKGSDRDRSELNRAYVETYDIRKNGYRNDPYTTPRIPKQWRKAFAGDDLPVALVMPPSSALNTFGIHCREVRELNRVTATDTPGVGLILPGSENIPFSAQPLDEALLAKRTMNWALGAVYKRDGVVATGPLFDHIDTDMNQATVYFKAGTAGGLKANKGALDFFEVAGIDGEYAPAKARIDGELIRIESDTVNRIVNVRYNWNKVPNQGVVNASELPAIPFCTEKVEYSWFILNTEADLPIEYSTPANKWKSGDVTLVNGQLKTHGYPNFAGWLGPIGIKTGPFGPNMGIRRVLPDSPAAGKLFEGDVIYSANGNMLGDEAWVAIAAAITESETAKAAGKLVLGVRRGGKNIDVDITLKVMGTYSSTAPFDCPKTEKIIADLEEWLVAHGGGAGFLNTEALFLLGDGNPKYQGLVRRAIYATMAKIDPTKPIEPTKAGKSWYNSADAFLLGEYYHATGDSNVLPYLKYFCDRLAVTQHEEGGWRHNFPGGAHYGLIPNAGLPGVMGMHFANSAGLAIDMRAYKRGVNHFRVGRAETGSMIYGIGYCQRDTPPTIDPAEMNAGMLFTANGGISSAGILMGLEGFKRAAHLCSFISAFSWNNTFYGHGGNFWNNFWTPLGAHAHGRAAYINFMKGHRWYRELNRMYDGSMIINEADRMGGGHGLALVAPRRRLRITGAPKSPFAADAPEVLKPALAAHAKRDYAGCAKLVSELLAAGTVTKNDRPRAEKLNLASVELLDSIDSDMTRMEALIKEGRGNEAGADLVQLKGVVPEGDARLAAIEKAVKAAGPAKPSKKAAAPEQSKIEKPREWRCLVTEIESERSKKSLGKVSPEEASKWRMKIVESSQQAPDDWMNPKFNDSKWEETSLPISWRMYHTALLRTTFTVDNRKAFDGLRFRAWLFRQQGVQIYLNGELIGKVNNLEKKTGNVEAEFKESALKHLKNGRNTLAVTTRHNWRWGMLFMSVYNDGFGFRLDARKK